jgi:hypothetical protein
MVKRLRDCENDPMWADHAEIPKAWCKEAADEIERLRTALAEETAVARETDHALARTDVYRDKLIAENQRLREVVRSMGGTP